jgi:hypothetical protein
VANKPTEALRVTVEGQVYDLEDFELGELEWIEDQIGMALEDATPMKQAIGFVAVIKRRTNPEFSWADARKMKLNVFDEPAATNGSRRPPRKPASTTAASGESS